MKVLSLSKSKSTITLLGMSNIIGSSTANPDQYEQYLYTQDQVTEVYLRRAYKSANGNYNSIRGYAPPIDPAGEKRPLYMRLAGTGDVFPWSTDVQVQTKDMAMRGLVALSVNYDNAVYPLVW